MATRKQLMASLSQLEIVNLRNLLREELESNKNELKKLHLLIQNLGKELTKNDVKKLHSLIQNLGKKLTTPSHEKRNFEKERDEAAVVPDKPPSESDISSASSASPCVGTRADNTSLVCQKRRRGRGRRVWSVAKGVIVAVAAGARSIMRIFKARA